MTLALGFAPRATAALETAQASIAQRGFDTISAAYAKGWTDYRAQLLPIPAAALPVAAAYETSLLVLKAHEDKDNPGAFVASPEHAVGLGRADASTRTTRARARTTSSGRATSTRSPPRCSRPATSRRANRALDFMFDHQQLEDGSFPQNTQVDGRPKWTGLQMDQVGLPIVLAWQLGRTKRADWRHVRRAADFIVDKGPVSEQERWENQEGYSPGTIAAEIAGLICAADIARKNGAAARAARYERTADSWARNVERWTATTNGPYSPRPYYLRLTKDRKPNRGTTYSIGDSGPSKIDQRRVVDVELPRAGPARRQALRRPRDPEHAAGRRPAAEGRRVLAPVQLRRLRRAPGRQVVAAVRRGHAHDARAARGRSSPASAASTSCSRAARRPPPGGDGGRGQRRRDAPGAGLGRPRADRQTGVPSWARGRSRRPRWRGPTRSSSGSPGPPRQGLRWSARRSSPTATRAQEAKRYPSLPTSRRCGVFL